RFEPLEVLAGLRGVGKDVNGVLYRHRAEVLKPSPGLHADVRGPHGKLVNKQEPGWGLRFKGRLCELRECTHCTHLVSLASNFVSYVSRASKGSFHGAEWVRALEMELQDPGVNKQILPSTR